LAKRGELAARYAHAQFGFEAWKGDDDGRFAGQGARPSFSFNNLLDLVRDQPFSQGSVVYDFLTGKVARYDYAT